MINQEEMVEVLRKYRGNAIVVLCMGASRAWVASSDLDARALPLSGAMGKGSSLALGLALAQPDSKVIVLDADGSLEMNLGSLVTIAGKHPENLYHFVMENGVYGTTGGQPIPGQGRISFAEVAEGAGYAATYEFDDLEDFSVQIEEVLKQAGPVFITIKAQPEIQNEPIARRARSPRMRSTPDALRELRKALETT